MSIQTSITNLESSYNKLKSVIENTTIMSKLQIDTSTKANLLFTLLTRKKNNLIKLNKPSNFNLKGFTDFYLDELDFYSYIMDYLYNRIITLASQFIDCSTAIYNDVSIYFDGTSQKLIKTSSDKSPQCDIIILDSKDVKSVSSTFDPESKTIKSELLMSIADINNISTTNFNESEKETIKNFISNIVGINNNIINNINYEGSQTGVLFSVQANPTFTNTITSDTSSVPTNFNINYIKNLAKNRAQVNI